MLIVNSPIDTKPIEVNHELLLHYFFLLIHGIDDMLDHKIFILHIVLLHYLLTVSLLTLFLRIVSVDKIVLLMPEKSNAKVSEYLAYRKFNTHLLPLLGWSRSCAAYRILSYIYLVICLSVIYFVFKFVKVYHDNILLLTKCFSSIIGYSIVSFKMVCLIIYREEVFELYGMLDGHIMKLFEKDCFPRHYILHKISKYRILTWNITLSAIICTIIYIVLPLITIVSNHIHHIQPDHPILILPNRYPWHVPLTGFIYRLHFVFESASVLSIAIVTVGVDSVFIFFVFMMIVQLREISYLITHIDEKRNDSIVISKCIDQYCVLLKCRDNLQKVYGPIILCMMTTNAMILCTFIYQLSQMKPLTIFKAIFFFLYAYIKVIQTYMYAWCGSHLATESEEYKNAIYAANWYGDKRFMTAIIIMLQQRPLILTACNFSIVSIDIFTKILNTTVSYYFLLKTLE